MRDRVPAHLDRRLCRVPNTGEHDGPAMRSLGGLADDLAPLLPRERMELPGIAARV